MTESAAQWVDRTVVMLAERGYAISATSIGPATLATKRVYSLGPFLPCTDHLFVHDFSPEGSSASFEELHEQAREYVESTFRLPRALRYHIPNTVSIGVSVEGFSAEDIAFAQKNKLRSPLVGGEKNSTYLIDVVGRRYYSQGIETTPGRYGSYVVTTVNPTNRTYEMIDAIIRLLFAERAHEG